MLKWKRGPRAQSLTSTLHARSLRREMTPAEAVLWKHLRDGQFLKLKFRRQVPYSGFVLDFYCSKRKVVIEVDGGQHNHPAGEKKDAERTVVLAKGGLMVLRYWNNDVLNQTQSVLEDIAEKLQSSPSPSPFQGEGVR